MSQSDNMATVLVALVIFAILILCASVFVIFVLGSGLARVVGGIILFAIGISGLYVVGTIAKRRPQKEAGR